MGSRGGVGLVADTGSRSLFQDGESVLVAVLRYSNRADPMFCKCGFTWGEHACTNTPPREEYRYDFKNPANAVVKLRRGYSVALDYPIDPYGA